MHWLHLLRHAKSSWNNDLEDRQRPLSKRGREAASLVGRRLPDAVGDLDLVLCSDAVRTRETLELTLAKFAVRPPCLFEPGLYLAECGKLIGRLRRLDEDFISVLLIGHNPGLHELAVTLAEPDSPSARALASGKFPTAARASFSIATTWAALGDGRHRLVDYVTSSSSSEGKG